MFYSGVSQQQRASKGVALFIKKSLEKRSKSYEYISDRIMFMCLKNLKGNLTLICVYVPEEGKVEESEKFYKVLLEVDKFGNTDQIVIGEILMQE